MAETYTPMIMQYLKVKEQYEDTLIFYRVGDFYEMFFEDAKIAAVNWTWYSPARARESRTGSRCAGFLTMR